jgi:uncharacterized BrkB/YihY/UPF0761 family membrane protein
MYGNREHMRERMVDTDIDIKKAAKDSVAVVVDTADQVQTQALNAVVAGFTFASAVAWMDFVRFAVSQIVKVKSSGASYYALTGVATTLLAVVAFSVIKMVSKKVEKPQVMYAVTA